MTAQASSSSSSLHLQADKATSFDEIARTSSSLSSSSSPSRRARRPTPDAQPKGWVHFVGGGFGGMCGAIVTSPLDVVKTRLQSDMYRNASHFNALRTTSASNKGGRIHGALRTSQRLAYHFVETGQLLREISVREGPRALFRGLGPTLVGVIPARSINFYTYGNGKLFIAEHLNEGRESPGVHLCAAAVAGIITATATNPIWVVKTRLQLQQSQRQRTLNALGSGQPESSANGAKLASDRIVKQAVRSPSLSTRSFSSRSSGVCAERKSAAAMGTNRLSNLDARSFNSLSFHSHPRPLAPGLNSLQMTLMIVRTEGVAGLYRGLSASYLGAAEGTIQWVLYEQLKRAAAPPQEHSSSSDSTIRRWLGTVGAAGTAKTVASLITYPHEVLRTRLRQQPQPGERPKYTGLWQTAQLVLKEEGVASFYGGLSAHLLRVVPNAAIMFVVYETMIKMNK